MFVPRINQANRQNLLNKNQKVKHRQIKIKSRKKKEKQTQSNAILVSRIRLGISIYAKIVNAKIKQNEEQL